MNAKIGLLALLVTAPIHAALRSMAALVGTHRLFSSTVALKDCCGYGCINNCADRREAEVVKLAHKRQHDDNLRQIERILLGAGIAAQRTPSGGLEAFCSNSEIVHGVLREAQYEVEQIRAGHCNPLQADEKIHEVSFVVRSSFSHLTPIRWFWVQLRDSSAGGGIVNFEGY